MRLLAILPFFAASSLLMASTIYTEGGNDLSSDWTAPTPLAFTLGSNQVFGTIIGPSDRDYFTFTVPVGGQIAAINVLPGTTGGGTGVSFFGIASGTSVISPTTTPNSTLALGLLGYTLYGPGDIGNSILNRLAASNTATPAAQGFSSLGPGNYSIWVQEGATGTFNYGFDILIASPEPANWFLSCVGLAALAILSRRTKLPQATPVLRDPRA